MTAAGPSTSSLCLKRGRSEYPMLSTYVLIRWISHNYPIYGSDSGSVYMVSVRFYNYTNNNHILSFNAHTWLPCSRERVCELDIDFGTSSWYLSAAQEEFALFYRKFFEAPGAAGFVAWTQGLKQRAGAVWCEMFGGVWRTWRWAVVQYMSFCESMLVAKESFYRNVRPPLGKVVG